MNPTSEKFRGERSSEVPFLKGRKRKQEGGEEICRLG